MSGVRPVWLTLSEFRDYCEILGESGAEEAADELRRKWDAAPEDAVGIVAKGIHDSFTSSTLNRDAKRILRGLGMP